jgi:hypothetical protein
MPSVGVGGPLIDIQAYFKRLRAKPGSPAASRFSAHPADSPVAGWRPLGGDLARVPSTAHCAHVVQLRLIVVQRACSANGAVVLPASVRSALSGLINCAAALSPTWRPGSGRCPRVGWRGPSPCSWSTGARRRDSATSLASTPAPAGCSGAPTHHTHHPPHTPPSTSRHPHPPPPPPTHNPRRRVAQPHQQPAHRLQDRQAQHALHHLGRRPVLARGTPF